MARSRQTCGNCGYQWTPRGRLFSIRCPDCGTKFTEIQQVVAKPESASQAFWSCLGIMGALGFCTLLCCGGFGYFTGVVGPRSDAPEIRDVSPAPVDATTATVSKQSETLGENNLAEQPELPPSDSPPIKNSPLPTPSQVDVQSEPKQFGRKWTSVDGQFVVQAEIKSVASDVVTIVKENQTTVKVPLDKLSEDDRQYVEQWKREKRR